MTKINNISGGGDLSIGSVKLASPFILAPMAGITDAPFRRICRQKGASLVYSEMISAKGLYYNDKATERLLSIYDDEKPVALQIFGSEPDVMAYAADKLGERENAILDINMGCPVPKVVKNGDGSALLKSPKRIAEIVKAVVYVSRKPVTVKLRLGWDHNSINILETAKIIEDAGASAIAVHGRTRDQYYAGNADWNMIRLVKECVSIPVIGNGDVFSGEDANRMLAETGCDFVMIARGSYGNPWIFHDADAIWRGGEQPAPPDFFLKKETLLRHLDLLCKEKGEHIAVKEIRKHIGWYCKGIPHAAELRRKCNTISCAKDIIILLENTRISEPDRI